MMAKFRNAGQTCVCANTFLVHNTKADIFTAKLAARVSALKVGDGLTPHVTTGPVISQKALENAENFVNDAVKRGARIVTGGSRLSASSKGNFFLPTVLSNVSRDSLCVTNEIFGPIAPIVTFTDEKDAILLANSTNAGLAAYFYTRDAGRCIRVADALKVGMVGINAGSVSAASAPFGGVKDSGYGREGAREGLLEYTETKLIIQGGF
jgi:acyl-CoA reductase-like NAD-dependent aldehyde dehydrogenase